MKPVVGPLLLFLLMGGTIIFGLNFKKVNVLSGNWDSYMKKIPTTSFLHCSLQCELDRDLFNQRTSCQAFTVTRYPGFCTMGYISPVLPPDFGSEGIEAWQEREESCCLNVKVRGPPVRCTDFGGCPNSATKIFDISGTYKHSGYRFGPRGRPLYQMSKSGVTFWLVSNQRNNWVLLPKGNCDEVTGDEDECKLNYFSVKATKYRSAECPGDLGPVWQEWSKNLSSSDSDAKINEMRQKEISVVCL